MSSPPRVDNIAVLFFIKHGSSIRVSWGSALQSSITMSSILFGTTLEKCEIYSLGSGIIISGVSE
jgi:hypothetical protein